MMLATLKSWWRASEVDVDRLETRVVGLLADLWRRRRHGRVLEFDLAEATRQLRRARAAVAVLYFGTRARRADGTVDVDSVIDSVLGEA